MVTAILKTWNENIVINILLQSMQQEAWLSLGMVLELPMASLKSDVPLNYQIKKSLIILSPKGPGSQRQEWTPKQGAKMETGKRSRRILNIAGI